MSDASPEGYRITILQAEGPSWRYAVILNRERIVGDRAEFVRDAADRAI